MLKVRTRSRSVDFGHYLLFRFAGCCLAMIPLPWAIGLMRFLSGVAYWVDPYHRRIAIENLRRAFPGQYTEAQLGRLVRKVFEHFGMLLLEILLLQRKVHRETWQRYITTADPELSRAVFGSERPVLIVTAHYGNWELGSYWPGFLGVTTHIVARPIDNPHVETVIRRFREGSGATTLAKNGGAAEMLAVLKRRGVVCTVGDQDAGPHGLFVDFLGRPASTHKAMALLALRTNALMYVVGMRKTGDFMQYTLSCTDLIRPEDYAGRPDAIPAMTQRMTTALERLVRSDPSQYFWFHRRWKNQPSGTTPPIHAKRHGLAHKLTPCRT
jgi:KDO2-lipid IV(A) lauroyltransferase